MGNILRRASLGPWDGKSAETWKQFFARHKSVWALDFFTVHSASFKRIFVFVIMDIHSRQLITVRVTSHPTAEWTRQVLNWEMMESAPPQGLIHDRDLAFESAAFSNLLESNEVATLRCSRRTPIANAYAETLNGTLRRECTDHFLDFGEKPLQRALDECRHYYNHARPSGD